MLIKINYKDKRKSKYMCDLCGKNLNVFEKHRVKVVSEKYKNDIWDFCHKCYENLFKRMWEE